METEIEVKILPALPANGYSQYPLIQEAINLTGKGVFITSNDPTPYKRRSFNYTKEFKGRKK